MNGTHHFTPPALVRLAGASKLEILATHYLRKARCRDEL
ncbi:hypothetical protein FRUB_00966 [Fimbriiglobus ruber]|uniref:Uncharacterized protein n=1 Tax=Fimbriiglobus ruber TaxID=1908690 RepID=A0A225EGB0_9BACT|nr:hypothetical protein FRUB_00966 [Fimbriiglobus ruber]